MRKRALITGITGQDGSYLTNFLLEKGYDVYGMVRRTSHFNRKGLDSFKSKAEKNNLVFKLCYGNLEDSSSVYKVLLESNPSEIYNFASQSHVHISYDEPEYTAKINSIGFIKLLEAIRFLKLDCRIFQPVSSDMFGDPIEEPQSETTQFTPTSPYAVTKLSSYWMSRIYRQKYNFFICNGILYNHESPYRGENFVTRKITYSLARIKAGQQKKLCLGNYDSKRDWGYAPDYVRAMWLMLQQEQPDDYIIATGKLHSVREFVEKAAFYSGFDILWKGNGIEEVGIDRSSGKEIICIDPKYYRPAEKKHLYGNPSKAKQILKWEPSINFNKLVEIMMKSDLNLFGV